MRLLRRISRREKRALRHAELWSWAKDEGMDYDAYEMAVKFANRWHIRKMGDVQWAIRLVDSYGAKCIDHFAEDLRLESN